jgi:hypothetical protein
MASSYRVDPQHDLILVCPTGVFSETEFISLLESIYDDPDREPHFSAVWDTRFIDELAMGVQVISMYRTFLAENADRVTEGKIAIITGWDTARTFASMLIRLVEPGAPTYRVVDTRDAAAAWMDLPTEALSTFPTPPTEGRYSREGTG